ncbi:MAG TPA: AAA family ATPase, partial [Polyangiaceae bacterium]
LSVPPQPRPAGRSDQPVSPSRPPAKLPMPLTHRDDDMAFLRHQRAALRSAVSAVRLIGEEGVGKTRVLQEFLADAIAAGDLVVQTGPDPWFAHVAYHAVRQAIATLARLETWGGEERDWASASVEARRGLSEVFGRDASRTSGLSPAERRYTVAEALRWALGRAAARAGQGRVILAIDDLKRVDGASRNAFSDMLSEPPLVPVLVIGTHVPAFDPAWEGAPARPLLGLPREQAMDLAKRYGVAGRLSFAPTTLQRGDLAVLPLYLDQLVRFAGEGGSDPPTRLADLVALRIERLAPTTRRVLQALAVLGDHVAPADIESLFAGEPSSRRPVRGSLQSEVIAGVAALVASQFVESSDDGLALTHPLVRDIVSTTIPATVRRELHWAAARRAETKRMPIEVRAMHTLYAQEPFEALLLLEQVADKALARDDAASAVLWLHRGLEMARAELVRGELDDPMRAVLIFSRKLGEALAYAGDLTDAEGVLREALDIAGPSGQDRANVLRALATVVHGRERAGEAMNYLREALEHASRSGSKELIAVLEGMRREWAT